MENNQQNISAQNESTPDRKSPQEINMNRCFFNELKDNRDIEKAYKIYRKFTREKNHR